MSAKSKPDSDQPFARIAQLEQQVAELTTILKRHLPGFVKAESDRQSVLQYKSAAAAKTHAEWSALDRNTRSEKFREIASFENILAIIKTAPDDAARAEVLEVLKPMQRTAVEIALCETWPRLVRISTTLRREVGEQRFHCTQKIANALAGHGISTYEDRHAPKGERYSYTPIPLLGRAHEPHVEVMPEKLWTLLLRADQWLAMQVAANKITVEVLDEAATRAHMLETANDASAQRAYDREMPVMAVQR